MKMQSQSGTPFFFSKNTVLISVFFGGVCFFVFHFFPQIDLTVTGYFYTPDANHGNTHFPLEVHPFWAQLRKIMFNTPIFISVGCLLVLLIKLCFPKILVNMPYRAMGYAVFSIIIVVLLIVDQGLKEGLGRVRPDDVAMFGGNLPFQSLSDLPGPCEGNCSFVSGEVSSATWLLMLLPLFFIKYRNYAYLLGIMFFICTIYVRIGFGRHFLSDALFAFFIPHWVMALLYTLFYNQPPSEKQRIKDEYQLRKFLLGYWQKLGLYKNNI